MADVFILSEHEKDMVLKHRAQIVLAEEKRAAKRETLRIAADYEAWLQDNGAGSTFSTFVDEFGYDRPGAGDVFKRIERVRAAAD